ncbi:MAG: alkaline phosphatase, partial [Bacteroidales bacterium]|nr:alkaline phosphatase [Bacteroidales bacterium]
GSIKDGKVEAKFTTTHHTGVMVPVFAYGPGAENFVGIMENTDLYHKIRQIMQWEK